MQREGQGRERRRRGVCKCACVRGSSGHAGMHARATHAAGDTSHAPSARVLAAPATSRARTATRGPHAATWRTPRPRARLRWPPGVPRCAARSPVRPGRCSRRPSPRARRERHRVRMPPARPPCAAFANLHTGGETARSNTFYAPTPWSIISAAAELKRNLRRIRSVDRQGRKHLDDRGLGDDLYVVRECMHVCDPAASKS